MRWKGGEETKGEGEGGGEGEESEKRKRGKEERKGESSKPPSIYSICHILIPIIYMILIPLITV